MIPLDLTQAMSAKKKGRAEENSSARPCYEFTRILPYAFDKGRQSTFSVIRLHQEIKTVAGIAGFFSAPVLSIGKTIEAAYIANIIVIHSRLAQRAETVDHTISILISTLQKPEAASEFPVDFAPIHC